MSRPRKKIDQEQLASLAAKQWSISEIAAFFGCSRDTIERRFAAKILAGRLKGTAKLKDLKWLGLTKLEALVENADPRVSLRAASELVKLEVGPTGVEIEASEEARRPKVIQWCIKTEKGDVVTDPKELERVRADAMAKYLTVPPGPSNNHSS